MLFASWFDNTFSNLFSFKVPKDILELVNKNIPGKLQAKHIEYILPNKIKISDLEVIKDNKEIVLAGKNIELSISLSSLLSKNIIIKEALIDGLFFNYRILQSRHNVIDVFSDDSEPSSLEKKPLRVSIAKINLKNATFEMEHDSGVNIFAQNISAQGNFWVEKGPFFVDLSQVNIPKGAIFVAGLDLPISNMQVEGLLISDQKVYAKNLQCLYESSPLSASGTVFIDDDYYDVKAHLDRVTNSWPTGLGELFFAPPAFKADIDLSGKLEDPIIKANIITKNTFIKTLDINSINAQTVITKDFIDIAEAQIFLSNKALIKTLGKVDLNNKKYDFKSVINNIESQEITKFLELSLQTNGLINSQAFIKGDYIKQHIIDLSFNGVIDKAKIFDINLNNKTFFNTNLTYNFLSNINIKNANIKNNNSNINFLGKINTDNKISKINYKANITNISDYLSLPNNLIISNIINSGELIVNNKNFTINSLLNIKNIKYNKLIIDNFNSKAEMINNDLQLNNISALVNNGDMLGQAYIKDIFASKNIISYLNIKNIDSSSINEKLTGLINANIEIKGDFMNPNLSSDIIATKLAYDNYSFGDGSFNLYCDFKKCNIKNLLLYSYLADLKSNNIELNLENKNINGYILVNNFELNNVLKSINKKIFGIIQGEINLSGSINRPYITGDFLAQDVIFAKNKLGMGPLKILISHDNLQNSTQKDLILSLSTQLKENEALSTIQASYAYHKKIINVQTSVENLFVSNLKINNNLPKLNGLLSANLQASGNIDNPLVIINSSLRKIFLDEQQKEKNLFGPIILSLALNDHKVNVNACASLSFNTQEIACSEKMDITLLGNGTFKNNLLDLELNSNFFIPNVENFLTDLKKDFITLSSLGSIKSHIKYDNFLTHETYVSIEELNGSMPNVKKISLGENVEISLNNNKISFLKPAKILFYPGLLELSGDLNNENLNLLINGEVPLSLAKFFIPFIQKAEGFAKGNLVIKGNIDKPILDGNIIFTKNAKIFSKKYLQPITLQGSLKFTPYAKGFVFSAEKMDLLIGSGNLVISTKVLNSYNTEQNIFDLNIKGKNIILSDNNDFIDTNFNVSIMQNYNEQKNIKAEMIINDGYATRKFNLKNFIANIASNNKSSSLGINFDAKLDLSVLVNRFVFDAKMLNIDIHTVVNGQISSNSDLLNPKFTGNLFIKEGEIVFPSTKFDLVETQINLDENSNKAFDPIIELTASSELLRTDFPILSKDTIIEMSLNGSLEKLDLSLKPTDGDVKLSQLKILLLLLSPKSLDMMDSTEQNTLLQGAKNAALMLSKEIFLRPLTEELQDLIEGKTDTKIQFGSLVDEKNINLSLLWKLGSRIELEGNYNYKRQSIDKKLNFNDFIVDNDDVLGNIKIKFLLLDHKPFGPLFFQTSFGAIDPKEGSLQSRASIKLIYRIFEK